MPPHLAANESSEDEYFSSVGAYDFGRRAEDSSDDETETGSMAPPRHPVASMQGAFEESILESTDPSARRPSTDANAEARRQKILESKFYDDSWTTRWKQPPNSRHHPLAKLMAQIVFGMHLLQQQAAKSDEEVVKILQTHVDEVDNFLEKTTEDFDLATKDIEERIRYLKLPMSHVEVFGTMLEDRQFRTQLLEGNDKIESIIERTSKAMNAALLDVHQGRASTKELGRYLHSVADDWPDEKADLDAVLTAMRGNEQGWKHCFKDLQKKGTHLRDSMDQLSTVIAEMSRMAAAASRRARPNRVASGAQPQMAAIPRSKFSSDGMQRSRAMSVDKPLPKAPEPVGGPVELEAHPVPIERRYEQPRPTPASPTCGGGEDRARRSSTVPPRPSTGRSSMTPRDARPVSRQTADIVEFLKEMREPSPKGELGSADRAKGTSDAKRQSAIDVVDRAKALSLLSGNFSSSRRESVNALPGGRRSSEPGQMGMPVREGISRNRHGPPPSGKGSSRRESSLGPFIRRLSFRRPSSSQSSRPNLEGSSYPDETFHPNSSAALISTPQQSATNLETSSPADSKLKPNTSPSTQRALSPNLAQTADQQPPPSTPSAASASYSLATSPSKDNPAKSENTGASSPHDPKLANGDATTVNVNRVSKDSAQQPPAAANAKDDKKRSRGLSLRKFFSGGNKPPKERVPRARMTYGDLA